MIRRITWSLVVLALIVGAGIARAEVDVPWAWIHQNEIEKACNQATELLSPFSAENGFPKKRPAQLDGKSWQIVYKAAAETAGKAGKIIDDMSVKMQLPVRLRLGATYFAKRMQMGSRIPAGLDGNERAYEFLCREFADNCKDGLLELRFWRSAEPIMNFDMLWAKPIREGLGRVRTMLPTLSAEVAPAQAHDAWKAAAKQLAIAANEAGMAASRVGGFDFPAWRLKYATKSFKATLKSAVVEYWDRPNMTPVEWVKAYASLYKTVTDTRVQIDEFLASLPQTQNPPR